MPHDESSLYGSAGLFATKGLVEGQILGKYGGTVRTQEEMQKLYGSNEYIAPYAVRMGTSDYFVDPDPLQADNEKLQPREYMLRYANDCTVGNVARGDCQGTNAKFETVKDETRPCVVVQTTDDIPKDGEIYVDYGPDYWETPDLEQRDAAAVQLALWRTTGADPEREWTRGDLLGSPDVRRLCERRQLEARDAKESGWNCVEWINRYLRGRWGQAPAPPAAEKEQPKGDEEEELIEAGGAPSMGGLTIPSGQRSRAEAAQTQLSPWQLGVVPAPGERFKHNFAFDAETSRKELLPVPRVDEKYVAASRKAAQAEQEREMAEARRSSGANLPRDQSRYTNFGNFEDFVQTEVPASGGLSRKRSRAMRQEQKIPGDFPANLALASYIVGKLDQPEDARGAKQPTVYRNQLLTMMQQDWPTPEAVFVALIRAGKLQLLQGLLDAMGIQKRPERGRAVRLSPQVRDAVLSVEAPEGSRPERGNPLLQKLLTIFVPRLTDDEFFNWQQKAYRMGLGAPWTSVVRSLGKQRRRG